MPSAWGLGSKVTRDEKVYYRTVYAFTNRLKVMAITRDDAMLPTTIDLALRGEALLWWTYELSDVTRIGLVRSADGLNKWCKALEERFKQPASEALATL